jgi:hypothetical protein
MHNLALPEQIFTHHVRTWAPQQLLVPNVHFHPPLGDYVGKYVPILWLLKNLKVLACVEWDFDNLDPKIQKFYLNWIRSVPIKQAIAWNRFSLMETFRCIRTGWDTAQKEGRKRPLLKSLDFDGNWK